MNPALPLVSSPAEPASTALRRTLYHLAEIIEHNWQGIVDDLDPEHLHDLRVATRRTRTALGELKGVLKKNAVAPFRRDFKWLATITGPCRDLDVWLDDLSNRIPLLQPGSTSSTAVVEHAASEQRGREWLTLKNHLLSPRFQRLGPQWRACLGEARTARARHGARPVRDLAAERILRAHQRLARRRVEVLRGATDETLHRTRVDAKKLRYLLEFFAGLYDETAVRDLIHRLKNLQDDLGRFNDGAVQLRLLAELPSHFDAADRSPAGPVMAVVRELEKRHRGPADRLPDPFGGTFFRFFEPGHCADSLRPRQPPIGLNRS